MEQEEKKYQNKVEAINEIIKGIEYPDRNNVSDGYHTFGELYDHRIILFIQLARVMYGSWRSLKHSDDSQWNGWFIIGIGKTKGEQITYHVPMKYWLDTDDFLTLDKAPEWDGHTSHDVLERLSKLHEDI